MPSGPRAVPGRGEGREAAGLWAAHPCLRLDLPPGLFPPLRSGGHHKICLRELRGQQDRLARQVSCLFRAAGSPAAVTGPPRTGGRMRPQASLRPGTAQRGASPHPSSRHAGPPALARASDGCWAGGRRTRSQTRGCPSWEGRARRQAVTGCEQPLGSSPGPSAGELSGSCPDTQGPGQARLCSRGPCLSQDHRPLGVTRASRGTPRAWSGPPWLLPTQGRGISQGHTVPRRSPPHPLCSGGEVEGQTGTHGPGGGGHTPQAASPSCGGPPPPPGPAHHV